MKNLMKIDAKRLMIALSLLPGALANLSADLLPANYPRRDFLTPDGQISALLTINDTIYLGGAFTYLGIPTGGGAMLNANGKPDTDYPQVVGTVQTVVPDGSGGWYIGGLFTYVGASSRLNLAHIRPDKTVDSWNPSPNGAVNTIALAGSTVYLGGNFTKIGSHKPAIT